MHETTKKSAKDKCLATSRFYHRKFKDIPTFSSDDLVKIPPSDESLILVDVRTNPETRVSKIEGAVTLKEFEETVAPTLFFSATKSEEEDKVLPKIVTYCTIGYRSGLEARRLRDTYRLDGHIYHLEGIIPYTHALGTVKEDSPSVVARQVVSTEDGTETKTVHSFGGIWGFADSEYSTVHFGPLALVGRLGQVGAMATYRTGQHIGFELTRCCRREKVH